MDKLSNIFFSRVSLGTWFGVPVYLHASWIMICVIYACFSPYYAAMVLSVFAIVLLHEFGHIFAGKYFGCETKDVTLYPFGGAANMKVSERPFEEFIIALAGPAVNLALVYPLMAIEGYHPFLRDLCFCNIVLLLFNLLPAFPMDGGRVLRSILSLLSGNHFLSTLIAVRISQVICLLLAGLGIYTGSFMLVVVGVFIALAAQGELLFAKQSSKVMTPSRVDSVNQSADAIANLDRRLAEIERRFAQERA